jgi:hypothetical protein
MKMERRRFLKASATGLTATTIGIAGCGGIGGGLEVIDTEARNTALGNVEIIAMVENTSSDTQEGELVTQVDIQGGDTYTEREVITVTGDSSNSYSQTHDIDFAESLSGSEYEYEASIEETD